jgi:hypothetical protein
MTRNDLACFVLALAVMFTLGAALAYGYTGGY